MTIRYQVMKIKSFFETHPVFRYEEFTDFMISKGTTRPASWRQQLGYHQKIGNLIHIRKFLYAGKPMFIEAQSIDPYLIAGRVKSGGIIAYHTALELHGIAYTTFNELIFLTTEQVSPFDFDGQRFRAVSQPKVLVDSGKTGFGVDDIKRGVLIISVTSLERTIVDVLARSDLGGGWEEIWRSLDNVTQLDVEKMVDYALLINNATTIAKVGFFLEQRPTHFVVDKKYMELLQLHIPKQPHYMDRDSAGEGKYIEKWNLIVPLAIINRTWEEPNADDV